MRSSEILLDKSMELHPNHVRALLSLSEILIREKKPGPAVEYMSAPFETEPSSWRPHAILAEAYYLQHSRDEAIRRPSGRWNWARASGHDRGRCCAMFGRAWRKRPAIRILQRMARTIPTTLRRRSTQQPPESTNADWSNGPAVSTNE